MMLYYTSNTKILESVVNSEFFIYFSILQMSKSSFLCIWRQRITTKKLLDKFIGYSISQTRFNKLWRIQCPDYEIKNDRNPTRARREIRRYYLRRKCKML